MGLPASLSLFLHQPPLLLLPCFLRCTPPPHHTTPPPPSRHPSVPLSWAPGIFRYWSPHYSSIQPQQTHKQISRLRRSQSPSPSLLCCAIRPQHTPVRWARGKAYCRLQPPLAPPPNPSASQPRVTAAPNTLKVICRTHRLRGSRCGWGGGLNWGGGWKEERERERERQFGALNPAKHFLGNRGESIHMLPRPQSHDSSLPFPDRSWTLSKIRLLRLQSSTHKWSGKWYTNETKSNNHSKERISGIIINYYSQPAL